MRAPTLITALVLTLLPCAANGVLPEQPRREATPPDSVLVKYRPGVTAQQIRLHADSLGIEMVREPGARGGPLGKLRVPPTEQARLLRELNASGLVEFAEPNYRRYPHKEPDDPRYESGEQWVMDALRMAEAWDIETGDFSEVKIAIIDDGVDAAHDDLKDNVSATQACFGPPGFCADANDGTPQDADDAHGTLVAGQAGAVGDNDIGITGTAWAVEIIPIRTDLTVDYIVEAIDFAIDEGVHIINASYGGASYSQEEYDAVADAQAAGILFVTSAGNSHTDNDKGMLSYPQAFDLDNVLTVAASDQLDQLTTWAQYGQTTVDVAAGGLGILSTNAMIAAGGEYLTVSGSSFASPLVAGIAALVRSQYPGAEYQEMKARIVGGADMTDGLRGRTVSGRANAYNALNPVENVLDDAVLVIGALCFDFENSVPVIGALCVDDRADGNGNTALDAGEEASLMVTVRSLGGGDAADLSGTLSIASAIGGGLLDLTEPTANVGLLAEGDSATLAFPVKVVDGFTGTERLMMQLDLEWDGGGSSVTRWFELELGVLEPNSTQQFTIGRDRHEHYHAFHVDVPAGATEFRIDTETLNGYDIDLLARHGAPPQYQINLGQGPDSENPLFAYGPDGEVEVSGRLDGNETLTWESPDPGTYHLVIVNFGIERQGYRLSTSWCTTAGCRGRLRFLTAGFTGLETQDAIQVSVTREGGALGAASVEYGVRSGGTAQSGTDYTPASGTLEWADGDSASKFISLPIGDDRTAGRTVFLELSDPSGATLMAPSYATVTLPAASTGGGGGGGGGGSGGGGSVPWWWVVGFAGLAAYRRTRRA